MDCPKCGIDVTESYEPDDHSIGIVGGWYCDACELGISEHDHPREPMEGDVPIKSFRELYPDRKLGTPVSEISTQPGDPKNRSDPRHAGYAEWKRIAKSWGHD